MVEFVLIACLFSQCYMSYGLAYLTLAGRGGNMFVNGILLSVAEATSAGVTGWALGRMADYTVFRACAACSAASNLAYYSLEGHPQLAWLRYLFLFMSYLGTAGCLNCVFVVMELRFPPQSMGTAIALTM